MSAIAILERAKTAIELGESHFREFKSALEGEPGKKRKRSTKDIATNIAQTLVAFANADGGELLVGVEDNGDVSGMPGFTEQELEQLELAGVNRVHADTPLPAVRRYRLNIDGNAVLYFSVPKSTEYVHITSDGRCLQRRDLESAPVSAEAVQFDRRERRSREYDREFVDGVSADDLELDLVRAVADQLIRGMSPEKCLQYLDLGEYGMSQLRLRRAALLLFAKNPTRWHPRLQIRILKVDGDEVKTGEEYNVVYDSVVTGNILNLVERAWEALRPHLVHTRFDKTARFEQRSIYPELACREALLNAIAHRDYSDEGRGIEVFIFSSYLEVVNPGSLLSSIRIEDIVSQKGVHQSRNTYVARVLRELGYMRELGEGMRRIYDLMHKNELSPPKLSSTTETFAITLTDKPLYSDKDLLWLNQFEQFNFDREQKAVILLGQNERVFSAKDVWDAVGIVDTEHYRKLVDSLFKADVLKNRIDRTKAKQTARARRIPFKEFPRYGIDLPKHDVLAGVVAVNASNDSGLDVSGEEKRVFIANVSPLTKKTSLFDAFSKFGDIEQLDLPNNRGRTKGFAFVEFEKQEAFDKALNADGLELDGRKLVIRVAQSKKRIKGVGV